MPCFWLLCKFVEQSGSDIHNIGVSLQLYCLKKTFIIEGELIDFSIW